MRKLPLIIMIQLGLSACSSEAPDNLVEVNFDDSYIENCVYQKQWQLNGSSEMSHESSLKKANGEDYANTSAVPMSAITEVKNCATYNADASFSSVQPYALPERAEHLQDLDKLTYLRHLSLDFPVADYSALVHLDKVETLSLNASSGSIDRYSLPLYDLAEMEGLTKLNLIGNLYQDYSDLRISETIEYLDLTYTTQQATTLDAGDLPINLKSLTLTNTWLANEEAYRDLVGLSEFSFTPGGGNQDVIEPNFEIFREFENLKKLSLHGTSFSDLSVIESEFIETLELTVSSSQLATMNWQHLERLSSLKHIKIETDAGFGAGSGQNQPQSSFRTRFQSLEAYNQGSLAADEYGVFDRVYAIVDLSTEQAESLMVEFDVRSVATESSPNRYLIDYLSPKKVVDLYNHWLQGEVNQFN